MGERTLYLISGPAGIGKSTVARALANTMDSSAHVSGDTLKDFHVKGAKRPWESEKERGLIWKNILSVSLNFLPECDVVVDYVAFVDDARWLRERLPEEISMKYVVLDAKEDVLVKRDMLRPSQNRMKARSLILKQAFHEDDPDGGYRLPTGDSPHIDLNTITRSIMSDTRFDFENNE